MKINEYCNLKEGDKVSLNDRAISPTHQQIKEVQQNNGGFFTVENKDNGWILTKEYIPVGIYFKYLDVLTNP
jgi:hypothetical protein